VKSPVARTAVVAILLLAIAATACGMKERRLAIRNCRFALRSVKPVGLDLFGARFEIGIAVENPNDLEAVLDRFDFDFYLNGNRIAETHNPRKLVVPPGESRDLRLEVTVPYASAAKLVQTIRSNDFKDYRVAGQVYISTAVGNFEFPVDVSGRFR
jgi:hypothetical protein